MPFHDSLIPNPIKDALNAAIAAVVSHIWNPLRAWLTDLVSLAVSQVWTLEKTASAIRGTSRALAQFFANPGEKIAFGVIAGFNWWFEPVLKLAHDWIVSKWD